MAVPVGTTPRPRARLGSRLIALVLLVTVPLAALSIVSAVNDRRNSAADAHRRTTEIANNGAAATRDIVHQTDLLLRTVGRLSNPSGALCGSELGAALVRDSDYRNLYSVTEDGTVACTAVDEALTRDVSAETWFRATQDRQSLTVTVPAAGLTSGVALMIVSMPRPAPAETHEEINGTSGPLGVLAASLDPRLMVKFAASTELPPGSVVQVVDDKGLVLARNVDEADDFLQETPQFDAIDGNAQGTVDGKGVDGVSRLYSYERVEAGGQTLYVMAGISRSEAYGRADTRLIWSLVIIVVLGVGVGLLALAAARSLVLVPVERLRRAISGFRAGDVGRRAGEIGGPVEVVELGVAFDAMADEIEQRLENQQRLLDQLEEASEAERQSIAVGIHDEVLQTLSAIGIRLQLLRRGANEGQQVELDRTRDMLDATAAQLRGLLFDLRPPDFDRIGLAATLRETLEVRFGTELDGWSVTGEPAPEVPDQAQILLYRVAQQALANAREHAEAHRVDIRFATTARVVTMEVSDDGQGFDISRIESESRPGHIGLQVMRDRARAVGGEVTITSDDGVGTTIRVDIPFQDAPGDHERTAGAEPPTGRRA